MMHAPLPSILSRPANDAPWWILPILTFVSGVAITAAVMTPIISTPDYKRGHEAGYKMGHADAAEASSEIEQEYFTAGVKHGRKIAAGDN